MQDRLSYEPKKVVGASCRKRKRTAFNSSQSGNQSKPEKGVHRMAEQYEQAPMFKDDRIRSLEEEIKALKNENEALKKRLLKEHACPICRRSYNRFDGLYKHLREGDKEHRRLAQERYDTKCETCGKECTRWGDLKKHMAIHEQKELGSADDLNLESDASMCPVTVSLTLRFLLNRVDVDFIIYNSVSILEPFFNCIYGSRECFQRNKLVSNLPCENHIGEG